MFHFSSNISNWVRKLPKKISPTHIGVLCLALFLMLISSIYALPISGSSSDEPAPAGTTPNILSNLFLSRNTDRARTGFAITDPTGASSDPETALSNQFKYANRYDFSGLAPGDKLDLSYEISNIGTEALDIRETYYILSFLPQSKADLDFAVFRSVVPASAAGGYTGTSALTAQKLDGAGRLYSFTSEPYTLSGSGEAIGGAPVTRRNERHMVFNYYSGNEKQGETIVIVATLGFKKHSEEEWQPSITETVIVGGQTQTMEYRTDTNVYLSCDIAALDYINPDNPGRVTFTVTDQTGARTVLTYSNFNSPVVGVQRAYVPFHIPDVPGDLTVSISSSSNVICDIKEIVATVVSSEENPPPDPTMNTIVTGPGPLPRFTQSKDHEWVTYSATKNRDGQWEYEEHTHTASLNTNFTLTPAGSISAGAGNTLGSGYGVDAELVCEVTPNEAMYNVQSVYCYFPEFSYRDYSRRLEIVSQDLLTTTWAFQTNKYSHSNSRAHYIPPAYPDGLYTVFAVVRDAWTPVGEMKGSVTAEVNIVGSLYDDWYITHTD